MTREAGRELDAEIAEKVHGAAWTLASDVDRHVCEIRKCGKPLETLTLGGRTFAFRHAGGEITATDLMPRYSSEVGAAWLVVERMQERGCRLVLESQYHSVDLGEFSAVFHKRMAGRKPVEARTAPLAICLAALSALSQEPDKP